MRPASHLRAFSLIELLIAIGIIGILISLALPALGKARLAARQTQALANVRSVSISFEQYASQYQTYPFIQPGAEITGPHGVKLPSQPGFIGCEWIRPGAFLMSSDPFEMEWMWAAVMAKFSPVENQYPTWVSPGLPTRLPEGDDIEPREQISIRYSNAFIARPELFKPGAKDDPKNIAPVRSGDVLNPSSKVMLFDAHLAYYSKRPKIRDNHYDEATPMGFADGHGEARNPLSATEGVCPTSCGATATSASTAPPTASAARTSDPPPPTKTRRPPMMTPTTAALVERDSCPLSAAAARTPPARARAARSSAREPASTRT
ncbi:MAG: prepilin-type N-terminal cleavage/methylation domain-containing protein [Phycisphaerales bacterium]|nr:prepilin-type N-terminal cleavage/methylation domain-containing protein [Phycisphaerales bacterium]